MDIALLDMQDCMRVISWLAFLQKNIIFFSRIVNSELVLSNKSYEFIYNMNNISILLNSVEYLKFDIVTNKKEREYLLFDIKGTKIFSYLRKISLLNYDAIHEFKPFKVKFYDKDIWLSLRGGSKDDTHGTYNLANSAEEVLLIFRVILMYLICSFGGDTSG